MSDLNKLKEELKEWQGFYEHPADEKNHAFFTTLISAVDQLEAAQQRIAELVNKTSTSMGIGDGSGNLFVYGDYDSIKAAQSKILRMEAAEAELERRAAAAGEPVAWQFFGDSGKWLSIHDPDEATKYGYKVRGLFTIQSAPSAPDGWATLPAKLSADNGAKAALSGEFLEVKFISCPECFGDDDCDSCDGSGRVKVEIPVSWTTIKAIWEKGVQHFSVAPAPGGE